MVAILAAGIAATGVLGAAEPKLAEARKLYNSTDFERSLKVLQAIPAKDGPVYELMGRNYFMQSDYKRATGVSKKPWRWNRPMASMPCGWDVRGVDERRLPAPLQPRSTPRKLASGFEKSVQLSPLNLEAQSDLFEYYMEAPGFLGGGLDKAQATASRMSEISPVEGEFAQAKLAEKRKESHTAEAHLRRAVELAPQQVGKIVELARFLMKQGRYQEADQSFERAEKVAPNSPRVIFGRASAYIKPIIMWKWRRNY